MTILFLGSGPFGVRALERLSSDPDRRVSLHVGTVPDAPSGRKRTLEPTVIKKCAQQLGLPVHEVATLKGEVGRSLLEATSATVVITADFRLMLPRTFLESPPRHCFNLHGSILPRWRGAAPIVHGVLAGDRHFGVTLYRMVRELDAGPIVACTDREFPDRVTASEIEEALTHCAADLIEAWIDRLLTGDFEARDQNPSDVTIAPKIAKHEGEIDWSDSANSIDRRIRALAGWPRTWSHIELRGTLERVFIDAADPRPPLEAASLEAAGPLEPGTITAIDRDGVELACGPDGRGRLVALEVQRAGRKRMRAADFARGASLEVGRRFQRA